MTPRKELGAAWRGDSLLAASREPGTGVDIPRGTAADLAESDLLSLFSLLQTVQIPPAAPLAPHPVCIQPPKEIQQRREVNQCSDAHLWNTLPFSTSDNFVSEISSSETVK